MDEHTEACLRAMLDKKQMQVLHIGGGWQDEGTDTVLTLLGNEHYRADVRIKPQVMCELAGVEFPMPMPMSAKPSNGDVYYIASLFGVSACKWRNEGSDNAWLAMRICHATKEAAEAHSQAMRAVNAQAVAKAKEQA